ncbi:MAG TPA: hypothetical protein VN428_26350 [Bryobacteraceae bacterium]|nr:hypothetical protein [Bryobacteraceae bacterium]
MQNLSVTDFIPIIQLPSVRNGALVQARESGGKTTLLVTLHSASCAGCREYLDSLAPLAGELDAWDGRLLVIVPGALSEAALVSAPVGNVLADEHCRIADPASASVIVADRYGHVFDAIHTGASHKLPSPRELEEWLKYLGTLCPE